MLKSSLRFVDKSTSKLFRVISIVLTLMILTDSLTFTTYATDSQMKLGISNSQCSGNLSNYSFPASAENITQGNTYYINIATTTNFKLTGYEFYIKAPGLSEYTLVHSYYPTGYFRWYWFEYTFAEAGTYTIKAVVCDANNQYTAEGEILVCCKDDSDNSYDSDSSDDKIEISWNPQGKTSSTRSSDDEFTINGVSIVPGNKHLTYYKNGTQSNSGSAYYCYYNDELTYVAAAQCMSYAYYIQLLYYGVDSHTTKLFYEEKDDGISEFYGVKYYRTLSADELKTLLQYTGPATHIRSNGHSISVLRTDDNGFFYTDANTSSATYGKNNIKLGYTTYADFASGSYKKVDYVEYYHG